MMRGVNVTRRVLPGGDTVEITHRESDPGVWIVRRRRHTFFGWRDISSNWFNTEEDAEEFARAGAGSNDHGLMRGLTFNS
jgi:hypothetical protein